jgi:chromate reductase
MFRPLKLSGRMEGRRMPDETKLDIFAICGSLRRASYNGGLLRVARALAPKGMSIEIADIGGMPLFNEDVERQGLPKIVRDFRERIRAADALLIATPEYNYSVPGVLKNAIDWASRPPDQPLSGKPVAIMGATPGGFGTTRSQHHLRQVFIGVGSHVLAKPELMVSGAAAKFDDKGDLTDEATRKLVVNLLAALAEWARRMRREQDRA